MQTTCWTCGAQSVAFTHRCIHCEQLLATQQLDEHVTLIGGNVESQLKVLAREAKSAHQDLRDASDGLDHLKQSAAVGNLIEFAQLQVLRDLSEKLPKAIARVESAVRWACEQLIWHIEQQTEVIRSIDETLKTPVQTRANEWRVMADILRERGALNESVEFYEKSVAESPLDFRTYVGFAEALIQLGQADRALSVLTLSLPHAPRNMEGELSDWRSHSLRTIAHIHHCQGSHEKELKCLQQAVTFSPRYQSARYEMVVAAAECQQLPGAIEILEELVHQSDLYFEMTRCQPEFRSYRDDLTPVLRRARDARMTVQIVTPIMRFRQSLSLAEQQMAPLQAWTKNKKWSLLKPLRDEIASDINSYSVKLGEYRALLERLGEAKTPWELADIAVRSSELKESQDAFDAVFPKVITEIRIRVFKHDYDQRGMIGCLLLIIVVGAGIALVAFMSTQPQ